MRTQNKQPQPIDANGGTDGKGDDSDGIDDEDGITFAPGTPNTSYGYIRLKGKVN